MDTIKNPAGSKLTVDDLAGMLELWIADPSCRREIIKQFHYGLYQNVYLIARFAAQLALEKGAEWAVDFSEAMERHDADTRREQYLYEQWSPHAQDELQTLDPEKGWVTVYYLATRDMAQLAIRDVDIKGPRRYRIFRNLLGRDDRPIGVMYE